MRDTSDTLWLIVEPAPSSEPRVEEILPHLERLGVDPFNARQRLIGRGPALLARGKRSALEKIVGLLNEHRFVNWVVHPPPSRFDPHRLSGLEISSGTIIFACAGKSIVFPRGGRVLAILADLSGEVVEKNLTRLLRQNAYRGAGQIAHFSDQELQEAILRASPVLDLYRLSQDGEVEVAVRAFPGRFDPRGLGEKATYSSAGNLRALLETVREHAGQFVLRTDFGAAALPGCQPKRERGGEADAQRHNLAALSRFGWLMADLQGTPRSVEPPVPTPSPTASLPLVGAISAGGVASASHPAPMSAPPADPLPLPPPRREGEELARSWLCWSSAAFVATTAFPFFIFDTAFLEYGVYTGAIPGLFSVLLLLSGFQFLRWKRLIEDTPTSRVRSLAMGVVEVHGRAVRSYALVSPMTHMACVWYRLRRYRRHRNGWKLTSTLSSGAVPFLLDDGTGRVRIDPRKAFVRGGIRQEGGGTLARSDEKWVEELIYEGTSLYVLGYARPAPRGPSLRERTAEALRALKRDPEAIRKYDLNGDGEICADEWEAARADVEAQVLRAKLEEAAKGRQEDLIVIGKAGSTPFIIAGAECEARLARSYGLAVPPLIGGGIAMAAVSAALLLRTFGIL